jgi:hypothetical protein
LPRLAERPHFLVARQQDAAEIRRRAVGGFQLVPHGPCGRDADLLPDDGPHQGRGARLAVARFGVAVAVEHGSEGRFGSLEVSKAGIEAVTRADHQATLAA